jgi:ribosomal protein S18 acetylase RimI-like enzyme
MAAETRVVAFADAHLPAAAALVAERHARLRAVEPALDERWSDPSEARSLVEAALARPHAEGYAALVDGGVRGFLVGETRLDAPWDRAGWVDLAGLAVAPDAADVARDLFAAWSRRLVPELGVFRFLVNVPAGDPAALEAWHQLGFGQMHAYAIRSTDASDLAPSPPGITVRRATPDDEVVLAEASELIWREQAGSPSWSPITPEQALALRADFVGELSLDDEVLIAEDAASGEALGISVTYPMDPELDIPAGSWKLASTATFDDARRRGAGRALVHAVLRSAADQGAASCVTDWRTSSLLASRTWPALGWRRTRVRLERRIDERVAWANGSW